MSSTWIWKKKYLQTIAQMVHFRLFNYFVHSSLCFVCVLLLVFLYFTPRATLYGIIDVWIDVSYGFDLSWFVLHFYGLFIAFIIWREWVCVFVATSVVISWLFCVVVWVCVCLQYWLSTFTSRRDLKAFINHS